MADLPHGTVTFAFTDIEDSTELLKRLGDGYRDVLSEHRRIVREAFRAWDGIEIDRQGDAFFFVFPRAREAVAAAVEAQRAHAAKSWPDGLVVRVRMGLHTGEPAVHEEGYVGLDVVRAARICTLGRGGQILLSETTRALLRSGLPDGVSLFPLGQRHLRGIDEPERVYEVAIDGAPLPEDPAEPAEPTEPTEPTEPATSHPASAETRARERLEHDVEHRFEDLGARLAGGVQERVFRSVEEKLGRLDTPPGSDARPSSAEDLAARMQSLGDEIDARVRAALAKKGVPPRDR